ncbi:MULTISPECIES: hypothetical protein [unclassified Methanosarcina]|uniref:hypothetical protein n=1 Tax=unclassified Methanosarcina TaxID=2644672 RepID=UPI00064FEE4C|nr:MULTISPECIES: hypothetical protein [unclassified Methanosarcina]
MERQQILKILIPAFTVVAIIVLSGVVAKNTEHDYRLIEISLVIFWIFGIIYHMALVKLKLE